MNLKIEIPQPDERGLCQGFCPLYLVCKSRTKPGCVIKPGPRRCPGPGVYELAPEGTVAALKDLADAGAMMRATFPRYGPEGQLRAALALDKALAVARKILESKP